MDQLLAWAFVHHEITRQMRKRVRYDDPSYDGGRRRSSRTVKLLKMVWPRL